MLPGLDLRQCPVDRVDRRLAVGQATEDTIVDGAVELPEPVPVGVGSEFGIPVQRLLPGEGAAYYHAAAAPDRVSQLRRHRIGGDGLELDDWPDRLGRVPGGGDGLDLSAQRPG